MLLPALWCLLNYALHLSLRLIGQLTGPIPLQDVFIVGILETVVIASGVMVLRGRSAIEPVRTIGILLFSGNALFLSLLFSHSVAHGFERLNALIRL